MNMMFMKKNKLRFRKYAWNMLTLIKMGLWISIIIGVSSWNWKALIFRYKRIKRSWETLIKVLKFRAYSCLQEKKAQQIRATEKSKVNFYQLAKPRLHKNLKSHTSQKAATAVISKPVPCLKIKILPKIRPSSSTNKYPKCQF